MDLNCQQMAGIDYNCPNLSTCMEHSRKPSMVKIVLYVLNKQICQLSDIKVNDKSLSDLLQEQDQDLEFLLTNLETFVVTQPDNSSEDSNNDS
jgi:hypothetical protein